VSVRLRKILGDVRANKPRSVLVGLSIAVGVAAIGMVTGARAMMLNALDDSRSEGAFASATLTADAIPPQLVGQVRRLPGVNAAGLRYVVGARAAGGTMTLFAVNDWRHVEVARVTPERGAWPPRFGAILVERKSLQGLEVGVGDGLEVALPGGESGLLRIAGTVHDVNVPSTRTSGVLNGYVTTETLRRLGDRRDPNELDLRVSGDRRHVERVAAAARQTLEQAGVSVLATSVPKPGRFWANDAVDSMVLLLTVLAVVCLLLSVFLVANIVAALVAGQVRQIGVMKALGARTSQAASLYLATAAIYGGVAIAVGVPVAALAALALVTYSAGIVNLDAHFSLPGYVLALELAAGLLLPLLAALGPALSGSGITVREAIARHGLEGGAAGLVERIAARLPRLPAAARLALTNTFRRKRRLLLTLAGLVVGSSVFIAVLSVRSSMLGTLDSAAIYHAYDVDVTLDRDAPAQAVERAAAAVPGVHRAEAWAVVPGYRIRPDGSQSESFPVVGAPAESTLLRPSIVRGRWLRPGDRRAVVVNTDVLDSDPGLDPGDAVDLVVNGRRGSWRVAGIARRVVAGATIYATREELGSAEARRVAVVAADPGAAATVARRVADRLDAAGFPVASARTSAELRRLDRRNFGIIVSFLLTMAVLLAVVASLGLLGTLSINVLERSREIGVLRAIGAGDGAVTQLVLVEALVVAGLGWLLALPLSYPIGRLLSDAVGRLFLGSALEFRYSTTGAFVWLGLLLALATAASLVPARRAARLPVRAVLTYE
jgi:putative ABC transport system permease protein